MPAICPVVSRSSSTFFPRDLRLVHIGIEQQLELFPARADGVEFLQSEADRIDQVMTAGACRIRGVLGQPLPVGYGTIFANGLQDWYRRPPEEAAPAGTGTAPARTGRAPWGQYLPACWSA